MVHTLTHTHTHTYTRTYTYSLCVCVCVCVCVYVCVCVCVYIHMIYILTRREGLMAPLSPQLTNEVAALHTRLLRGQLRPEFVGIQVL